MSLCIGPRTAAPLASAGPARAVHMKCAPSAALAPFVEYYWLTRWDRSDAPPRAAASLLDPCVHLQVRDGEAELMGVQRAAFRVQIEGAGCVIGARFRPGGFYPFVGCPVAEWTDRTVPASTVFVDATPDWARSLTDAALACTGDGDVLAQLVVTHLDALLLARLPERDAAAERAGELVATIAERGDVRRVGDLVRASALSERTLHRLFARYVGASPAWVIRRYRLHAAAARLTADPPADVRTVAWDLGYADQAHFIRDFRATIGLTPGAFVQLRRQAPDAGS